MRLLYKFIFAFVFCFQFLNLQASEIVNKIEVIGNKRVPTATIIYYLDFKVGSKVTQNSIDNSIRSLYSQGFFSDISITQISNNTIAVKVQENPIVRSISILNFN